MTPSAPLLLGYGLLAEYMPAGAFHKPSTGKRCPALALSPAFRPPAQNWRCPEMMMHCTLLCKCPALPRLPALSPALCCLVSALSPPPAGLAFCAFTFWLPCFCHALVLPFTPALPSALPAHTCSQTCLTPPPALCVGLFPCSPAFCCALLAFCTKQALTSEGVMPCPVTCCHALPAALSYHKVALLLLLPRFCPSAAPAPALPFSCSNVALPCLAVFLPCQPSSLS